MDTTVVILVRSLFVDISLVDMLFQMAAMVISIDDTMSFLLLLLTFIWCVRGGVVAGWKAGTLPPFSPVFPPLSPPFSPMFLSPCPKPIERLFHTRHSTY